MKRILDVNPLTGAITWWHDSPEQDGFSIQSVQDVEPVLEHNKARMNDGTNGWTPSRDMKHVATVPMIVLEMWAREAGIGMNDSKALEEVVTRKLNDPDFRYFRTSTGDV